MFEIPTFSYCLELISSAAYTNILILLMCLGLTLLSANLNFILFSAYLDDFYGQLFSLFILTIAASESAIGLAILIVYYRIRGDISINKISFIKN